MSNLSPWVLDSIQRSHAIILSQMIEDYWQEQPASKLKVLIVGYDLTKASDGLIFSIFYIQTRLPKNDF